MLENLITSKTRLKLLLKFFLNINTQGHLRGLEDEFGESTNSIRVELNRFEQAGMLTSKMEGNRKVFKANPAYPLFPEIQLLVHKHLGIDKIIEEVTDRLGQVEEVYLGGSFARGVESPDIEIVLVGGCVDAVYLDSLIEKARGVIKKNIVYRLMNNRQFEAHFAGLGEKELLLLWQLRN